MLAFKNVTKWCGKNKVLDNISINFEKGKITCLLGSNESGNSAILKAIMCLTPINSGTLTLDNQVISYHILDQITYIPDLMIHDLSGTILQNLEFSKIFYPTFDMEKAQRLIDFFKLPRNKKLKELSKQNLARFNLTVAFARNTPYVLLDHPFSNIDPFTRESFIYALKTKFLTPGQTLIITSYQIDEIQNIADSIIFFQEGQVLRTPKNVAEVYKKQFSHLRFSKDMLTH